MNESLGFVGVPRVVRQTAHQIATVCGKSEGDVMLAGMYIGLFVLSRALNGKLIDADTMATVLQVAQRVSNRNPDLAQWLESFGPAPDAATLQAEVAKARQLVNMAMGDVERSIRRTRTHEER